MMNDFNYRNSTLHVHDPDEDDGDYDLSIYAYKWINNVAKNEDTDSDDPAYGIQVDRLGKKKLDTPSIRKMLKPEAIAARGLKEWARLEPVYTTTGHATIGESSGILILYDSPSRQPTILGRGFLPPGHDPALFHPLPSIRISRLHTLIWRELRDYNGDNTDINNYVIKVQALGSGGTSIIRQSQNEEQNETVKLQKDSIVDLPYDPKIGIGLILGKNLYEYRLVLSPSAPLIPRGAPPPRVDTLLNGLAL